MKYILMVAVVLVVSGCKKEEPEAGWVYPKQYGIALLDGEGGVEVIGVTNTTERGEG